MSVLFLPPSAGAASVPDATETVSGKIRIATSAEATTGTDDTTAITPLKLKSVVDAAVVGGVTYKGTFDAAAPLDLSNAEQGDLYVIDGAGTYQGQTWAVGDHLLVNADMGGTVSPSKIDKIDSTDSVTSVAGRTGAVTLSTADISGLATVASTGAYSDLTGTPTLATVATTGAYSDLTGTPTLATVATTGAYSDLTGTPTLATVATTGAYSDLSGTPSLATVATTGAYSDLTGTPTLATVATTGAYSDLTGTPTLGTAAAEDVGTSAGNVVQLNGSAQLPAVDGSLLTNISATVAALDDIGDVSAAAPSNTNVIKYNSTSGDWESGTVAASEVSGLATVATTGAYSDLTGTPTLATVATTGAYSDLSGTPTLGTAAALDVGTSASNVVQLDGSARLPAVDGSQLTNLPSGATTLGALTDVDVTGAVDTNVLKYDSGTSTWVDGAVAYSEVTGTPTLATVATTGAYSDLTGTPTLGTAAALDVGTSANNVVQLNGSAQLPAVDGSLLTGITATVAALNDIGDVSAASPNNGDVIAYNSTSGDWEATAQSGGGGSAPSVTVSSPATDQTLTSPSGIEEVYIYTPSTAINVNLVAAATCGSGFKYQIKNASANTITIDPNSTETIDGASTFALSTQYASVTIVTDGSNWFII
jgi:hypothetical protein